ncbi:hypothetical protein D3OALGA1CA_2825 [Olavius algarvensis associated proteobacterium Delta 3]|nr:hypothetical protein D3OALGA1CA_2825 [Olavius algarvensis associated proteobacterium Delta 3]CAB5163696.1 hypothetical protein D3OALGB2SA_5600 [Olavius algarvensis associated proteobacterium Delta 3]
MQSRCLWRTDLFVFKGLTADDVISPTVCRLTGLPVFAPVALF